MKHMVHPLRNLLSRLRWKSREDPDRYIITYRHRGAANDIKEVKASEITRLGKSYFILRSENSEEEITIPFHRILEISDLANDSVIWKSRKKPAEAIQRLAKKVTGRKPKRQAPETTAKKIRPDLTRHSDSVEVGIESKDFEDYSKLKKAVLRRYVRRSL